MRSKTILLMFALPLCLPLPAFAENAGESAENLEASAPERSSTAETPAPAAGAQTSQTSQTSTPRPARVYPPEYLHRMDIGGAFGLNSTGGFSLSHGIGPGYGLETDFRLLDFLSVGAAIGNGTWGPRLSASSRVYPLSIARSVFVQGTLGFNTGRSFDLARQNEETLSVRLFPASTASASLGYRFDVAGRGWVALQAGWSFALHPASYTVTGERELTDLEQKALRFMRPSGLVLGISGGFSVL
jgi:hypothetical protein